MEIKINGLKINYLVIGEGKPFLILHGWGSNSSRWQKIAEIISRDNIKAVIPDLPGFGESQKPEKAWGLDNYVDFIEEFADALGLDHFYLSGHSFGGAVAAKFAIKTPHKIKKLFLIDAACIRKKTSKKFILAFIAKIFKVFSFFPFYAYLRNAVYRIIKSDYPTASGVLKEIYLKIISEDLSQKLSLILIPTIIIWGAKDSITPLEQAHFINKEIKGSKLTVIPDAGHDLNIKKPEDVAKSIILHLTS
jgi:pimeloyl-ACP methyl ester carboxylesterase